MTDEVYIPAAGGNRQRPDPVVVHFRAPSKRTLRTLRAVVADLVRDGKDPSRTHEGGLLVQQLWLTLHLVRVDGFAEGDDARAFIEHAGDALLFDVAAELVRRSGLGAAERKNSGAQPGSCSGETPASGGPAGPAAQATGCT